MGGGSGHIQHVIGSGLPEFRDPDTVGYDVDAKAPVVTTPVSAAREALGQSRPAVLYFPVERNLVLFPESYKSPGKMMPTQEMVYRWAGPTEFGESFEALLYAARWEDLNARDEGRPVPGRFSAFADAFTAFTGGQKRLRWHNAELCVECVSDGALHGLEALSQGEKQILLLTGELRYHWRPGAMVLIDELELHLHPVWQARLWKLLVDMQREKGGQLIVTTQSNYLFGIVSPKHTMILGRSGL